ncbi:hypothetical protein MNEG_2967 [Monoraphidium neglectum]|uniref:Uncharacterized protein n=1 Tax=Monoraphidium neglectum TaxID=145388 RepID=A0A0D2MX34_9CHLO|nr:hypothetical protein MNEG_2967 [Monoraphidium neglectum]KIZ04992.1 hypothetical protein MNEG_2967 [Monoraphidium neglectum]|eukprot:XP_013904011.1 hypothetical protein MNEG_2967 [Monoraphidium neglectum]
MSSVEDETPQKLKPQSSRGRRIPSFNDFCATTMDDAETLLSLTSQGSSSSTASTPRTPAGERGFAATFARSLEARGSDSYNFDISC